MGMMLSTLRRLFPQGRAWWLPGNLGLLVEALAESLEVAREFIRGIIAEGVPWTATSMLPEWHEALGLRYDPTQTVAFQQRMLDAVQSALGNTTLNALNEQVHKELASVDVSEISATSEAGAAEVGVAEVGAEDGDISPFIYKLAGTVEDDAEALRVSSILSRFGPLHLQPYSEITILSDTGTSEVGIGTVGIAEVGYAP